MNKKILVIIGIILMLMGSFFDWQLSNFLVTLANDSIWEYFVRFFHVVGGFMALFIPVLVSAFFTNFAYRKYLKQGGLVIVALSSVCLVIFCFSQFYLFSHYLKINNYFLCLLLGLILAYLMFRIMNKIPDSEYHYYKKIAILGILYLLSYLIIVEATKIIWARPRYWWLIESGNDFVPWYIINGSDFSGISDAYKSFPSGHTAHAMASIYLTLWFTSKNREIICIALLFGILVAISRILGGYHFLSDVTMGATISLLSFYFWCKILKLKNKNSS
ncbi:MAG: phosphatase PAP2 family protein [Erysipelotrichaceae bacterium]